MGWQLVRIYSFVCDHPSGCLVGYESLPFGGFWAAVGEIRASGWQVRRLRRGMTFYCPDHREDRDGGTDGDQEQTAGQFETAAPVAAGGEPDAPAAADAGGQWQAPVEEGPPPAA